MPEKCRAPRIPPPKKKTCSHPLKSFHKDTIVDLFHRRQCNFFILTNQSRFFSFKCSRDTECARERGRRIKIVGCQTHTMHHDEGIMGDGDQGRI